MTQVIIKNSEDRRLFAGILADNGYTVKMGKIKVGSQNKTTVEFWKNEEEKKGE